MPNKSEEQLNEEIMNKKELDFGKMLSDARQQGIEIGIRQGRDEVIKEIEKHSFLRFTPTVHDPYYQVPKRILDQLKYQDDEAE